MMVKLELWDLRLYKECKMSQTTKLYLSKKWTLEEIKDVMENHLEIEEQSEKKGTGGRITTRKFKIEVIHTNTLGFVNFQFKYKGHFWTMAVFNDTDLSIGNMYELYLDYGEEAIEIMNAIAKVFGGLLVEDDCGCKGIRTIRGMLDENNGLPFFIRYMLITNQIKDENDLVGLNEAIHKWLESIKYSSSYNIKLFPK